MAKSEIKLVILDAATYGDVSLAPLTSRWSCTVHQITSPEQTLQRLSGHQVVVTNKVAIEGPMFSASEARDLKLIAVAATGTDIIDREAAARHGVKVCNVAGYATQSVAQFTLALILELATSLGSYRKAARDGTWQKSPVFALFDFPSIELKGKKLGIVGYGNIGRAVGQMAEAMGMEIMIAARPGPTGEIPPGRFSLEELFRRADIITLHCPLTPATQNLINRDSLALMKPTAFLINTARGALVDEAALIEALRKKKLAAAALDVISREPPPPDHPIIRAAQELDNLLVTPHTAWSARETRERLIWEVAENIASFFAGKPRNLV
jgi:glycerate dehydrogenase